MVLIGLIFIVVAIAGAAWVVAATNHSDQMIQLTLTNINVEVGALLLFIAGMIAPIVLMIGLLLIRAGARRSAGRRRARKAQEAELNQLRRTTGNTGPIPTSTGSSSAQYGTGATQSMPGSSASTTALPNSGTQSDQNPR